MFHLGSIDLLLPVIATDCLLRGRDCRGICADILVWAARFGVIQSDVQQQDVMCCLSVRPSVIAQFPVILRVWGVITVT
jgi:hypothetical protein